MKKVFAFIFLFIFSSALFAQYRSPESIVWDNANKRYYVSNAGAGSITALDWGGNTTTWASGLTQPKGMQIVGNILYVADVTAIKSFNIKTGQLIKNETISGALFLNDICKDDKNNLYITDTRNNSIYKYDSKKNKYSRLAVKGNIQSPNGIMFDGNRLIIVSFRNNSPIQAISLSDLKVTTLLTTQINLMDGISKDGKGNIYFSAWISQSQGAGKVYKVKDDFTGSITTVVSNQNGPADIFYNQFNDTLAIPNMNSSSIVFRSFIEPPPAPKPLAPAKGSAIKPTTNLRWSKSKNAATYTVQTANNSGFANAKLNENISDTTLELILKKIECDTLFWRVKAKNTKGESPWSETWFLVPPSPVAPIMISPANMATDVRLTPKFIWHKQNQNFIFIIDTVADFSSPYKKEYETSDTTYTFVGKLLPTTKHYWTVKGTVCDKTVDGTVWSFTTKEDKVLPAKPELNLPLDKSKNIKLDDIEFTWKYTTHASSFIFRIATDKDFNHIVKQANVLAKEGEDLKYKLDKKLVCNKNYFWKVTAHNDDGDIDSDVFTFKTVPCTGIEWNKINNASIIPNPASSTMRIEMPNDLSSDISIDFVDCLGTEHRIAYSISGNYIYVKGLEQLPTGLYFVRINSANKNYLFKVVIAR